MTEDELKAQWDSKKPVIGSIQDVFFAEPDIVQAAVNLAATMKAGMDNLFNGGAMQYDFSHFYHEKTVDIVSGETV